MRTSIISAALVAAASVVPASAVGASPPHDVTFEVPTTIADEGPTFGPFTATGAAVDDGVMCESGQTFDLFGKASGATAQGINFQVVKRFICDDGSGSFDVKLQVRIDRKGDNFQWVVLDGTGDYAQLRGAGDGVGFPFDGGVFDVYQGGLHVD